MDLDLFPRQIGNSSVTSVSGGWRLEIPAGDDRHYRLAQVDDYVLSMRQLRLSHRPPRDIRLRARVSAADLPGTWGFGLWNDPFGFALGFGGTARHLPSLPQTAWFFHAGEPNWLSSRMGPHRAAGFSQAHSSPAALPRLCCWQARRRFPF